MQAITAENIKSLMRPSYHLYRKPYKGEVKYMQGGQRSKVTVYIHKDNLFDVLEKYSNDEYVEVEVEVLTPELTDLYGDGPPPVKRQTGKTMYDLNCWGRFAGGARNE